MKTINEYLIEMKCLIIAGRQRVDDIQAQAVLSESYNELVKMQKELE